MALVLAAKYRRPLPIILGILAATVVNHALAGAVGAWLAATIGPVAMRWIQGISFIAMAIWILAAIFLVLGILVLAGVGQG